jgi:hypothetical protein
VGFLAEKADLLCAIFRIRPVNPSSPIESQS